MENLLPAEIKLDIFSRLPAESVLKCRQVCKAWGVLLHHPCFAHMHLRRSLQFDKVGLLYFNGKYGDPNKVLYYGEYDENDEQSYKKLTRINHPPVNMRDRVVGSCNGLICYSKTNIIGINDPIYICNPITREYVNLPSYKDDTSMERYILCPMVYGFGYLPSTNEYKVVRILFCSDRNKHQPRPSEWVGSVEVYTLGGGSGWRKRGEIMYFQYGPGIFANGALNWLVKDKMKIVAFDLADEEFRLLPSPPCFVRDQDNFFQLNVLGGVLCFIHKKSGESINIWSLRKKNSANYNMKEQEYQTWSWHKELSISWEGIVTHEYELFAFTKSSEVLLWYNNSLCSPDRHKHSVLSRYDPKTATLKKLDTDMLFLQAINHLNSFVSLKALGEVNAKIIESAEGLLEQEMSKLNCGVKNSSSKLY